MENPAVRISDREHILDLVVACPARTCLSSPGNECKGLEPGTVHFGRRLLRLLRGIRLQSECDFS